MIEKILDLSVRNRWFIVLLTAVACALGVWSLNKLPIDAVPDVTNNQVQINAIAPALSPVEIEKQITFQIENILAGTPTLEYTRSFSRNGFAQVTAVFRDNTRHLFRAAAGERAPAGDPAIAAARGRGQARSDLDRARRSLLVGGRIPEAAQGCAGCRWQTGLAARRQLSHAGRPPSAHDFERAVYLRTVQDWIIRPQMRTVPGVAGVDAIGGYVKQYQVAAGSGEADRLWPLVRRHRQGDRGQQCQPRRELYRAQRRRLSWCAPAAGSRTFADSATSSSPPAAACRCG